MKPDPHIVIAGGKTGGHLFPGIAVAQAVKDASSGAKILFVGTNAPFETQTLALYGFDHQSIIARPVKGKSLVSKAWSALLAGVSLVQAIFILLRFRADVVLGVGGFSSFALVLAGRILGLATAIQEQNAVPGMTNRILSRFADQIFTAFEQTRGFSLNPKTRWVGNPIRLWAPGDKGGQDRQARVPGQESRETEFLKTLSPEDFLILVTGGSQGAASINQAFAGAAAKLSGQTDIFIVHQTGAPGLVEMAAFYAKTALRVKVQAFFQEMPAIQDRADLVIARAGAGTLAELAVKGKAAILVPYPHAADDHQTANALNFSDRGAALVIPDHALSPESLYAAIQDLTANPEKRQAMAAAAKSLAMPRAAQIIAHHILGTEPLAQKGDA